MIRRFAFFISNRYDGAPASRNWTKNADRYDQDTAVKLGISSYAYAWAIGVPGYRGGGAEGGLTARGLLRKASDLGVRVIQIADNLPLHTLSDQQLGDLERLAAELRVGIEVGARGLQDLSAYLELAVRFSSPILRVVVDSAEHQPDIEEVIQTLRFVVPAFERQKVVLALENHDRFTARQFRSMVEAVGSPNLGICLDTVNSFGALEGPEIVLEVLAPFVVNLHIKDFTIYRPEHNMGFTIEGRPAGKGKLNVPWLLDRLGSAGRDPNAILELWVPPESTVDQTIAKEQQWVEISVQYLRTLIPG